MDNHKPKRYKELDALRGIAALMVVFFHFTLNKETYNVLFKFGTTGVDLFFLISGFVIFMSLKKTKNSKAFIINRVSRLYPTYWASVTFTFLLIIIYFLITNNPAIQLKKTFFNYLGNLTMFQFYMRIPNLDTPYWTMIIEMLFYISILFLFQFKLLKYLNSIGIILSITSVVLTNFFNHNIIAFTIVHGFPLMQFIPLFLAGTVFYKIYSHASSNKKANYLLLLFCLLCQLALFPFVGGSHYYISFKGYSVMLIIFFSLFILFINHRLGFIVNDITLFFGKISFALYLTHQFISLTVLMPLLIDQLKINFWVAILLIIFPITIVIATFITYRIEIPYGKMMKQYLQGKSYIEK